MKIKGCIIRAHTQYTQSFLVLQAELGPGPVLLTKAVVVTKVTPMLNHVFAQCALWLWIHVHF